MPLNEDILKTDERAILSLRSLYKRYGYVQYKMSKFEEYDLYGRNKDFLISDGIITFTDTTGKLLALKPDVTLSIINNSKDIKGYVQKLYYNENVYRISKSSHTFKEIMQTGLECIGDIDTYEICEVVTLAIQSLETIDDDYVMDISHIGLVSDLLNEWDIPNELKSELLTYINQKNAGALIQLCKTNNISEEIQENIKAFINTYPSISDALNKISILAKSKASKQSFSELKTLCDVLIKNGLSKKINIDFSVANDMNYYNGIVFKGYIKEIPNGILSGGQYDKLMQKMGRSSRAIGFAVYLDMLERLNRLEKTYDVDTVLVNNGDIASALKYAEQLSKNGSSVFVCKNVPKHIKYQCILKIGDEGVENG